jgi:hypothetical protein
MKKNKTDIPEEFLKSTAIFMDKGLKKLRVSLKEVSFLCPCCNKRIVIKF